jgi:diaminopimelate epimerase
MGNPHAVVIVDDVNDAPVTEWARTLQTNDRFPEGVNVEFMQIVDRQFVRLRVVERGVGETLACSTGACAGVVAGRLLGKLDDRVKVSLPGGKVRIVWQGESSIVEMIGPATWVYDGELRI